MLRRCFRMPIQAGFGSGPLLQTWKVHGVAHVRNGPLLRFRPCSYPSYRYNASTLIRTNSTGNGKLNRDVSPGKSNKEASLLKRKWDQFKNGITLFRKQVAEGRKIKAKSEELGEDSLTRREVLHMRQLRRDKAALVPFAALLIILPEIIPFVLILFPGLLPSAFAGLISREGARTAVVKNRGDALHLGLWAIRSQLPSTLSSVEHLIELDSNSGATIPETELAHLQPSHADSRVVRVVATYMGLTRFWRGDGAIRRAVVTALQECWEDDDMLEKELDSLSDAEVLVACEERHIGETSLFNLSTAERRKALAAWTRLSVQSRNHAAGSGEPPLLLPCVLWWTFKKDVWWNEHTSR